MPPLAPSSHQTAGSSARKVRRDAAIDHNRKKLFYIIFIYITIIGSLEETPNILHRREMGRMLLDTIENGPPLLWLQYFRMTKASFDTLCGWLTTNTKLRGSLEVSVREKVLIFLFIVCQGTPQSTVGFLFGRSDETVNRVFHRVMESVLVLAKAIIKLPGNDTPAYIKDNRKFFPFFQDCLGAIDGSHYACRPSGIRAEVYRNRKCILTTNVLAAVDFQGRFVHMLAGYEGSAHDWKVYMAAIEKRSLVPRGKYLLADAGYNCSYRLLTPFRGVRYHLQESARHNLRPATSKELYNLRHSQARIMVEKAIGRHKSTFRINTSRMSYPVATQVRILYATAGLMNWIIDHGHKVTIPEDEELVPCRNQHQDGLAGSQATPETLDFEQDELTGGDTGKMAVLRRRIASDMWQQYQDYLGEQAQA